MISKPAPTEAYVWVWLPGAVEPVVAGLIEAAGDVIEFTYGRSYLSRRNRVPLYLPELPLEPGRISPPSGMWVAGCIHDAAPDAWGRRVVMQRLLGHVDRESDPGDLTLMTYLLESGSERFGALDFQSSATEYVPRWNSVPFEEMVEAAALVDAGEPLSPALDQALLHGSSIGGARPKVLLEDGHRQLIAKLSSRSDSYPVVKAEAASMELARQAGLNVARTEMTECLGHDVLMVERFDRTPRRGERRMVVSALTMLGLEETMGRYATYHEFADLIRARFVDPKKALRELFGRIVFNILVSNTDDHARNHAAFWDGNQLELTPGYDITPQLRSGGEAAQLMAIGRDGYRYSRLGGCIKRAEPYLLTEPEAKEIVEHQVDVIKAHWGDAADAARLTSVERQRLWGRQFLNPYAFEDD